MKSQSDARYARFRRFRAEESRGNVALAPLVVGLTLTACGGSPQILEGPSPLTELARLGTVGTEAQPRPGEDVTHHRMEVYESPATPPRLSSGDVPMESDELVVGLVVDGQAVAYPVRFLNLVEVVNDTVADVPLVVSWCPLAGTAAVFHRVRDDRTLTFHFGTSLMHDSLLLVDEQSGTVWAQIPREGISGPHQGERLEAIPSVQTTWRFWRELHPDTDVMAFPGEAGLPYYYSEFEATHFPDPLPEAHDASPVGVGVIVDDQPWFFPFDELDRASEEELVFGDGSHRVVYEAGGLTAWVEDEAGTAVDSQVAYERAWLAFYPESRMFRTSGVDGGAAASTSTRPTAAPVR